MSETLWEYLMNYLAAGVIDFSLRAKINQDGNPQFYIHPSDRDGQTRDFEVLPDTQILNAVVDGVVKS